MVAAAGRTVEVWWGTPTLVQVGGVREKSISANGEPIEITNDDDEGWRTFLDAATVNGLEIGLSGVLVNNQLKIDWFAGASAVGQRMQALEIRYPDGAVLAGNFYLQDFSDNGAHDDAVLFEATFMSSGAVTFTPGS